ncbi:NAD(P)H-dependent oxidoreductase [Roseibium sp. SCP14]|uniref:NAD(P)H-dependent oxidoreductase n=1 Tax=Roseibium sp. SCP14 TaxID=3141375 RepID=UPI00333B9438
MKCLVVVSHPLPNSLCRHLANRVVQHLIESGHDVLEEDLYAQGYDPTLSDRERETYYGSYDASQIEGQVKRLQEAEALVLVFPTWWFGFPAILKGWFDRAWGPGLAYDHADDFGPIKPKLFNLRQVLAVTTLGSPWWVDRLVMWQPVRRILKHALLGACTRNSRLEFLSLYGAEKIQEKQVRAFEAKIVKALDKWR